MSKLSQTIHDSLRANLRVSKSGDVALIAWLAVALACGFLAYVSRVHEVTHDVFHEMALFREALATGGVPTQDVFAFTPTVNPSVHHEWGTGAILYLVSVESGLGLAGIAILRLLLISGLWLLLYRVARMRGAHPYIFAVVAATTFPFFWVGFSTIRAQLFTLVFLAAQMWMQELDWRGRRGWVIAWWLMLVAWLNIHAGFIVGVGMFGFHCAERFVVAWLRQSSLSEAVRATWHLIAIGCCVAIALPINPYGWQYVWYLFHAITMPRPLIVEWHALWNTYAPELTMTAYALSVFLFAYCLRFVRLSRQHGAAFLGLSAYEALQHIRHGSLYGAVWLAYVPAWLTHTPFGRSLIRGVDEKRSLVIRGCQGVGIACLLFACENKFWRPTLPPEPCYSIASFPTGAVDYLKQHEFRGDLLTPFAQGAYISWTLYPKVRVSLDGRYEVAYEEQVMLDHYALYAGSSEWPQLLEKYDSDAVLVDQASALRPFLDVFRSEAAAGPEALPTEHRWKFAYEDDAFVVLVKEGSALPRVDRRGQPLVDGAWSAFSREYSFRGRRALAFRNLNDKPESIVAAE